MIKVGFIGCGNMGGTLAKAVAKTECEIYLSDRDSEKLIALAEQIGAKKSSNDEIARDCDMIFLGVKPQVIGLALDEISDILANREGRFVLVSMAAGMKLYTLREMLKKDCPIIRIMPNTPAAVNSGMILYCGNQQCDEDYIRSFVESMKYAGVCDEIDEANIDAASAVSGCGPAFVYMFIEALADGGVKSGLPRDKALKYAAQTVLGAGKMVFETGIHPGELKDAVCSPAGSTIEGVRALENSGFRSACIEAVSAAYKRTKELGKK